MPPGRVLCLSMLARPHSTVEHPGPRLPVEAVRIWEDQLATRGDVVNGHARLRLGRDGELLAEIQRPAVDGKDAPPPLWVACDGVPSIATGLTPEVVPGMPRGDHAVESRSEAVRLIGDRLRELEDEGLPHAGELRAWLTQAERGGADARTVLDVLPSSPLMDALTADLSPGKARIDNCFGAAPKTATKTEPETPAGGPASATPPQPTTPTADRAAPDIPLWEVGMRPRGTSGVPRPTTQQPRQLPPGHERPGPGLGVGD